MNLGLDGLSGSKNSLPRTRLNLPSIRLRPSRVRSFERCFKAATLMAGDK
jgi:hypothetical protein